MEQWLDTNTGIGWRGRYMHRFDQNYGRDPVWRDLLTAASGDFSFIGGYIQRLSYRGGLIHSEYLNPRYPKTLSEIGALDRPGWANKGEQHE